MIVHYTSLFYFWWFHVVPGPATSLPGPALCIAPCCVVGCVLPEGPVDVKAITEGTQKFVTETPNYTREAAVFHLICRIVRACSTGAMEFSVHSMKTQTYTNIHKPPTSCLMLCKETCAWHRMAARHAFFSGTSCTFKPGVPRASSSLLYHHKTNA